MSESSPGGCDCCGLPIEPDEETYKVIVREIDFYERSDGELEATLCVDCLNRSDDDVLYPTYANSIGDVEWSVLELAS